MVEKMMPYDFQVFGFENEKKQIARAEAFTREYENAKPIYPLIDAGMNKQDCLKTLLDNGIEIPAMYRLGYSNSNCIMCPKGGQGYANKVRRDFPEHFERMAKLERLINATCLHKSVNVPVSPKYPKGKKSVKLFLDELDPEAGRHEDISLPECGVTCPVELVV
jgi:3'-phosphoadenosine 5'-phosphosulfate sulfotransferase (PAPS reductase)/FAD synthetase